MTLCDAIENMDLALVKRLLHQSEGLHTHVQAKDFSYLVWPCNMDTSNEIVGLNMLEYHLGLLRSYSSFTREQWDTYIAIAYAIAKHDNRLITARCAEAVGDLLEPNELRSFRRRPDLQDGFRTFYPHNNIYYEDSHYIDVKDDYICLVYAIKYLQVARTRTLLKRSQCSDDVHANLGEICLSSAGDDDADAAMAIIQMILPRIHDDETRSHLSTKVGNRFRHCIRTSNIDHFMIVAPVTVSDTISDYCGSYGKVYLGAPYIRLSADGLSVDDTVSYTSDGYHCVVSDVFPPSARIYAPNGRPFKYNATEQARVMVMVRKHSAACIIDTTTTISWQIYDDDIDHCMVYNGSVTIPAVRHGRILMFEHGMEIGPYLISFVRQHEIVKPIEHPYRWLSRDALVDMPYELCDIVDEYAGYMWRAQRREPSPLYMYYMYMNSAIIHNILTETLAIDDGILTMTYPNVRKCQMSQNRIYIGGSYIDMDDTDRDDNGCYKLYPVLSDPIARTQVSFMMGEQHPTMIITDSQHVVPCDVPVGRYFCAIYDKRRYIVPRWRPCDPCYLTIKQLGAMTACVVVTDKYLSYCIYADDAMLGSGWCKHKAPYGLIKVDLSIPVHIDDRIEFTGYGLSFVEDGGSHIALTIASV